MAGIDVRICIFLVSILILMSSCGQPPKQDFLSESIALQSPDFQIELKYSEWSRSINFTNNYTLTLNSNGTSNFNHRLQMTGYSMIESSNVTLTSNLVDDVYQTMNQEGFFEMNATYDDLFFMEKEPVPERVLSVVSGENNKMVVFRGNSIYGLMPKSAVGLENLLWAVSYNQTRIVSATIEIDLDISSSDVLRVNASVGNNEDITIYGYCGVLRFWDLMIVGAGNGSTIIPSAWRTSSEMINDWNIGPGEKISLPDTFQINLSALDVGSYVVVVHTWIGYTQGEESSRSIFNYTNLEISDRASTSSFWESWEFMVFLVCVCVISVVFVIYFVRKRRNRVIVR